MNGVRQYIISVIAAALICSIVNCLLVKKSTYATVIKLICGLFLTMTVVGPLTNLELTDISSYINEFSIDAQALVDAGSQAAETEKKQIIKEKTEAYILDKAASLGLSVTVDVMLESDVNPLPSEVKISGAASPYAKRALTQYITETFSVAEEDQIWT